MKNSRVFQSTALLLVVVAVVQVGWWLLDQYSRSREAEAAARTLYSQHILAAQTMLDAGIPEERVREILPGVQTVDGRATLSPQVDASLRQERRARMNQYGWESAFFLVVLCACIAVIWRALRAEARALQEQDSFLALVSHQFKTPLASLQLSLETMSMRTLSPEQSRTLIDRMLSDLSRMETMVSQILDSVRLEGGRVDLKREPIDLASAVTRVVNHLEERAKHEKIRIEVDVPRGLEVLADPLAVDVVVRNLLENAIAAVTPVGGGTITLNARRVGNEIELTMRDSGVGFRPADSKLLFRKFSRLHPGGGSSYHGTGLGLYIVRRLMQLAGGRVSAHSEGLGQGALFVLAWPMARSEAR